MHAEYETINHHKQTPIKTSCSSFSRFHSQCCLCVSCSSLLTLFKSVNRTSSQYHFSFTFKYQHIFIRPPSFCLRTLFCQSTSVCWYANGSTVKGIAKIRASIKCWKLLYSVCALNSGFYYCFNGVRGWLFACYNLFDLNTFQFLNHFNTISWGAWFHWRRIELLGVVNYCQFVYCVTATFVRINFHHIYGRIIWLRLATSIKDAQVTYILWNVLGKGQFSITLLQRFFSESNF